MSDSVALATKATRQPLPQPEPGLTPQDVIERARALRPLLREQQDEADRLGHYTDQVHQTLKDGGLYRILQPRLFGGYEFDYPTFIKVILELSIGHPSAGWCYTLGTSHGFLVAAHWCEEAQWEVFGPDGDVRVCQRATPAGTLTPVKGGYILDGGFGFCSGAPIATHFIGSTPIVAGKDAGKIVNFVLARDKWEMLPDWGGDHSLGMQGSGSNTIKVDKVFVPEHHIATADIMMSSRPFNDGTPGTELHGNPMYIGVAAGAFLTEFGAITTGAARAAIEEYERLLDATPLPRGAPGATRRQDPETWRSLGKAMNMADSAWAITLSAVNEYMEQCAQWGRDRTPILPTDTLKLWGMSQEASQLACRAVDLLFETAGPRAALGGQRMQRYFRDIQMYRVHTTAQPAFATLRAQAHLGLIP